MEYYFLFNEEAIAMFKEYGAKGVIDCKANYKIVKYDDRISFPTDLLNEAMGQFNYLRIYHQDVIEITRAKNINEWEEFRSMISDGKMNDSEFLEYISKYYKVPAFIHEEDL